LRVVNFRSAARKFNSP